MEGRSDMVQILLLFPALPCSSLPMVTVDMLRFHRLGAAMSVWRVVRLHKMDPIYRSEVDALHCSSVAGSMELRPLDPSTEFGSLSMLD
jgi:hypothetical protein